MAINGTFTLANGSGVELIFNWSATQSAVSNTSTINWKITTGGSSYYAQIAAATFSINNSNIWSLETSNTLLNLPNGTEVASGTYQVAHDTVGNGRFTVKGSAVFGASPMDFDAYGWFTDSETIELDQIIRNVKIVSAPNFDDEQDPTITYSNPAGNVATSLYVQLTNENESQIFATRNLSKTGSSYTIALSDAERNTIRAATPNSRTINIKFKLVGVISNTTRVDSVVKVCTIINSHPSVTATVEDVNPTTLALTGDKGTLVRYYSNAKYAIAATAYKSATVKSYSAENGALKLETATGTLNAVESNLFKFSVVDSRNNLTVANKECPMVNYVKLTCNFEYTNPTTTGDMTFTVSGNYFNNTFGAVNNALVLQYRSKADGGEYGDWITLTPTLSNNTYSVSVGLSGLDYQTGYTFEARASDRLNPNYVYSAETYTKALPVFHWSKDDVVFEVPVVFNAGATGAGGDDSGSDFNGTIEGDCNITGNLRLKGSGNYGNALYFGDKEYCYLKETTDDDLTIHSSDLVIDVGNFKIDDASTVDINATTIKFNGVSLPVLQSGTWTPSLSSSAISSYSTRQGWFTLMGDVVTVGFFINATCKSGYSSTTISISGLPFTPGYSGYGGGFATGVYVPAGYNFQCWAANTDGTITPRVQPCNNTAAGNLTTSTACYYNSSTGAINIGGTITYRKTAV